MACFIVPAAEAIVTTIAAKALKSKEEKEAVSVRLPDDAHVEPNKIRFSTKLGWLSKLLWGGVILLAFEHVWHGEVVPWFPFLTAMADAEEAAQMFHEMATVGVSMAVLVTAVWACMVLVSSVIEKRAMRSDKKAEGDAQA